jgi:hypothetical protein
MLFRLQSLFGAGQSEKTVTFDEEESMEEDILVVACLKIAQILSILTGENMDEINEK